MRTIKEALEEGSLSLEDEIYYADMTEEEYKKEIERLKKREQECIEHYLVQCKYASEMEAKYIIANNIINELEKDIKKLYTYGIKNNAEQRDYLLNRLEELKEYKGSDK